MNKKEILYKLMKLEHENNFYDYKFNGQSYWGYLKYNISAYIISKYYNVVPIIKYFGIKNFNKIKGYENRYDIYNNIKDKEILIFNHPRRMKYEESYITVNSDIVAEELSKLYTVEVIEEPFSIEIDTPKELHLIPTYFKDISYTDLIEIEVAEEILLWKKKKNKNMFKLKNDIKNIVNILKFSFPLIEVEFVEELITSCALYSYLAYSKYKKIFQLSKPKAVFMFYSPSQTKIITCKLCKELGIPCIELQHGMGLELEPFFYQVFNKNRNYDSFPDYIFSFGESSENTTHFPVNLTNNIRPVGWAFLDKRYEELKSIEKPKIKNILFISQLAIGKEFAIFASNFSELIKDDTNYHIYYKLHPFEQDTIYSCLNKKNITIVKDDLNYCQSISTCQVGVFSTGLYEGLRFKIPTIILNNFYGAEVSHELLGNLKGVYYINDEKQLYEILNLHLENVDEKEIEKLWKPFAMKNIIEELKKIIRN